MSNAAGLAIAATEALLGAQEFLKSIEEARGIADVAVRSAYQASSASTAGSSSSTSSSTWSSSSASSFTSTSFSSSSSSSTASSSLGLTNIGNSCYINVIIQLMYNIRSTKNYFLQSTSTAGFHYGIRRIFEAMDVNSARKSNT
jgi:ubiquitin C-terminal hydrolase